MKGVGEAQQKWRTKEKKDIGDAPIGTKSQEQIKIKGGHMSPKSALQGNVTFSFFLVCGTKLN